MTSSEDKLREYLRLVTTNLQQTKQRLELIEGRQAEPIAIVGMACRFPGGVQSPEDLWRLVDAGVDAIGGPPGDRGWDLESLYDPDPDQPGKSYVLDGGFVDGMADFDAELFGISPREALAMDPQQRLLLESAWEAIERARIDPLSLRGSQTGVFVGGADVGYGELAGHAEAAEGHLLTGAAVSVMSGRIAYSLGLEGPAMSIDTACSSSLVATHLAVRALRSGECSLALAAGVAVMPTPRLFIQFSRARGLAPDGRSKPFADAADGTSWAEGVGVLLLARLSDAQRHGYPVLAVVRGSGVNTDGASSGLTAPNGPAQQRIVATALADAQLPASHVDAVEAHGTGTALGDPIEAQALLAAYGQDRDRPLLLGGIKSNIGHTQAAAGMAGLIKMVMAIQHGVLPRTLHIDKPSTHVDWSAGAVSLLTERLPWPETGRPRRAGVSAFGISGTNAHVLIEQAPATQDQSATAQDGTAARPGVLPWPLSGRTREALRAQAARLLPQVAGHELVGSELADVGLSLAATRAALGYRAVVLAEDRDAAARALAALAAGTADAGVIDGVAGPGRTAFLFSGQGSQRLGMGRELSARFSVFADTLDEVCGELDRLLDQPLRAVMWGDDQEQLDQTAYAQPALFATGVALFRLLESLGVHPDFVGGHSVGELAAAHVAGVLSLADACALVAARGALMGALPPGGAMTAIEAAEEEVVPFLAGEVSLAAVNGPSSVVISGAEAGVEAVAARFPGRRTRRLRVSHAFHSPLMEPMLEEFRLVLSGLSLAEPAIPLISNLTGALAGPGELSDPGYWVRHVREPVRFADGVTALEALGVTRYAELGPDRVLAGLAGQSAAAGAELIALLHRDQAEPTALLSGLARLHVTGGTVDWTAFFAGSAARPVDLPTYAFQRQRYWPPAAPGTDAGTTGLQATGHPLVSAAVDLSEDGVVLTGTLSVRTQPWLADHVIGGSVLVPATALLEMAIRAGDEAGCGGVAELTLGSALILPERTGALLRVQLKPVAGQRRHTVSIHSRMDGAQSWVEHATGTLAEAGKPAGFDTTVWPPAGAAAVDLAGFHERLTEAGFAYGPAFRGLRAAWRHGDEVFAEVALPDGVDTASYGLHPALLDAAVQVTGLAGLAGVMPFSWSGVTLHASGASVIRVRLTPVGDHAVAIAVADAEGTPVASVDSLMLRPVRGDELAAVRRGDLLRLKWMPAVLTAAVTDPPLMLAAGTGDLSGIGAVPRAVVVPVGQVAEAAGAGGVPAAVRAETARVLGLVRQWLRDERFAGSRLVFVTRGATAGADLAGAAVQGLVRSAQAEHPERFRLIDSADARPLPPEALASDEPELLVRDGRPLVPRLARVEPSPDADPVEPGWDDGGMVLITGGTGGLGAILARHLVTEHKVSELLLVSRRGLAAPGAAELASELTTLGAEVVVEARDVADRAAVDEIMAAYGDRVTAVVHTAGVLDDAMIESLTPDRLDSMLAPKVDAAWHLQRAAGPGVRAIVFFSSAAGTFGGPGQGGYAAGNAFLDGLARQLRAAGRPAVSLAWGPWVPSAGMTAELSWTDLARISRTGLVPLGPGEGMELFDAGLAVGEPVTVATRLDLAGLRGRDEVPPLWRGLVRTQPRRRALTGTGLDRQLTGLPPARQREELLALVQAQSATVLGHAGPGTVDPDRAFTDLGFDSLSAVELRNRLAAATGLTLPATLVFDYPNAGTLAGFLHAELTGRAGASGSTATGAPAPRLFPADDPVVIVGMACRYPGGADTPEQLWDLVAAGTDAIVGFPADRGWDLDALFDDDPSAPGRSATRLGGFLPGVAEFDPGFFGMSPREAVATDAQQRLLLETAWEAVERAQIDPVSLRGSATGVFAGVMYSDYRDLLDGAEFEGYRANASAPSVASGRVSYAFGFEGPAVTVDTACSSSLVALHLAAQSLRGGECTLALAGGVTVMATPGTFVDSARQGALAADGRCKSYADTADGAGWSEGVGMVVLERLSDARRHGHPVLAVLRGSAVNQDGASNGLTAPNGPSQQRVIRAALGSAGLSPAEVDVVEGHGTGTRLGDPIEAQALLAAYGQDRERPLLLGSVKSNIGHAQAAAGVAGVIKMVMAMRHGIVPASLHLDAPSARVDWSAGAVELVTEAVPWPEAGRPRRAGVSSFGISGTNAHVIVEQAGPEAPRPAPTTAADDAPAWNPPVVPWAVSAKSAPALDAQLDRVAALAEVPGQSPVDVGFSLATSRSVFGHRAVLLAGPDGVAEVARGTASAGRLAVLFPGQGSQRLGMGRELHGRFGVFAAALDGVCAGLDEHLDVPLRAVMWGQDEAALEDTAYAQPALFATGVALFRLLESLGVHPDFVGGHSVGELAAAHVAGVLSLADACALVAARGALMGALPPGGAMIAVEASETEVAPFLGERVSLAAVNGPSSVVVSGREAAVEAVAARFSGRRTRRLRVSHAFHSPLMEPMLERFAEVAGRLSFADPVIGVVSNVSGALAGPGELSDPGYWVRHVREPVRFGAGIAALRAAGVTWFAEAGPGQALSSAAATAPDSPQSDSPVLAVPLMRGPGGEEHELTCALARLHVEGTPVDWAAWYTGTKAVRTDLPTYPFQRQRYWPRSVPQRGDVRQAGLGQLRHPLIGAAVELADTGGFLLTGRLSRRAQPWLGDHVILGSVLAPGTVLLELAVQAADQAGCGQVEELTLAAPLLLPDADHGAVIQISVGPADETGRRSLSIQSQPGDEPWTLHATGLLAPAEVPGRWDTTAWPPDEAAAIDLTGLYDRAAASGFDYGTAFRGLRAAWRRGEEIFAETALPDGTDADGFALHPALLDAGLHVLLLDERPEGPGGSRIPFAWRGVSVYAHGARSARVRVARNQGDGEDSVSVTIADDAGNPVLSADALVLRPVAAELLRAGPQGLFGLRWVPDETPAAGAGPVAVLGGDTAGLDAPCYPDLAAIGEVPGVVLVPVSGAFSAAGAVPAAGSAMAAEPGAVVASVHAETARVLGLVRQWLADQRFAGSRLVFVTRGATAGADLAGAAVQGLVRSAQAEHPGRFGLIDTDRDGPVPAAVLATAAPESLVRDGQVLMPRLARIRPLTAAAEPAWGGGLVLITGGTGGLGAIVARHLAARHGVRDLLLVSRRGAGADGAAALTDELAGLGATAVAEACDVGDRQAVTELVDRYRDRLSAVIHAAGVLDDGMIDSLTPERLDTVLAPKADGAWYLHEVTAGLDLAQFVLFSSAAGLLGGAGQGNYAAANAFADALARHRRAVGQPGLSLVWGPWAQAAGMTGTLTEAALARISRAALLPLTPDEGLELFDAGLAAGEPVTVTARLDLAALRAAGPVPPLLQRLIRTPARRRAAAVGGLARQLDGLPPARRRAELLALVVAQAAAVLGHASPGAVQPDQAFTELGFDSLTVVELRNRLDAATGLRLPATLAFDYPNADALAGFLLGELTGAAAVAAGEPVVARASGDDPIVIVGMACRYPGGVRSPEQLWDLVAGQNDAITAFPADRGWDLESLFTDDPEASGRSATRRGGFLHDAAEFDAGFFGLSPREALATDAQQRLLLQTAWEALERAGIDPAALRGSATGVFAGLMYSDYRDLLIGEEFDGFRGNGSAPSIASGRVSYALGLEGPAVTVDTACSSSLVALHWAAQALRAGECSLALAGGVTVMATPHTFTEFSRQGGLSPDGRCRSFSAGADGTGWSEGVGLLVLERLSDARRHDHQVLAVVAGSAVNQDGASNGLTAPNGPSQQRVIRMALASARVSATDVDVVEGHGTGTSLGDPIEVQALMAAYGQDRERPLLLGSVKSNIGHAQAAAGVAGVIKMVMAIRHGIVPPTLHADAPSSQVDWSAGAVELVTEAVPWPEAGRPRRAGVSSFGISGTNAHVILEQPEPEPLTGSGSGSGPAAEVRSEVAPWPVSAKSAAALDVQVAQVRALAGPRPVDVGFSLATSRSVFGHRAVLLAGPDGVAEVARGTASAGRLAVLFPGQGSQRLGMGRELHGRFGVFAAALDGVCAGLDEHLDVPLRAVMWGQDEAALEDTAYAQPALFATGVALFRLLESLGVHPDFVGGHSVGELAAAHVAGVLSLADACALVAARGALMGALPPGGAMTAIEAAEEEVVPFLAGEVSLAAVNGPSSVVISGAEAGVEAVAARFPGRRTRRLRVSHAFHSPLMEPMLEEFRLVLSGLSLAEPAIPLISNLTGALAGPGELSDPGYWVRHVREPVRFGAGIAALRAAGVTWFAEAGPGQALSSAAATAPDSPESDSPESDSPVLAVALMRGPGGEEHELIRALARLHVAGATVDWAAPFQRTGARRVALPTYPFQQERFWPRASGRGGDVRLAGLGAVEHGLLGAAVEVGGTGGLLLTGRVSVLGQPWLADHAVLGSVLVPGTALLELAVRAADQAGCGQVAELTLAAPLVLPAPDDAFALQISVDAPDETGRREIAIRSCPDGAAGGEWTLHAAGTLAPDPVSVPFDAVAWPPAEARPVETAGFYERFAQAGLVYGPAFRGVRAAWRRGDEVFAEIALPDDMPAGGFDLHPALLDGCVHVGALLTAEDESTWGQVPFSWTGVSLHARGATAVRVRVTRQGDGAVSVSVADTTGAPVASVTSLAARPMSAGHLPPARRGDLFDVEWMTAPPAPTAAETGSMAVVGATLAGLDVPCYPDLSAIAEVPAVVVAPVTSDPPREPAQREPAQMESVRTATARVLELVRYWLADERFAGARLVFVTRGAGTGADLAGAAVQGLVRSAQAEHPGRFGLVDLEGAGPVAAELLTSGDPEVRVRDGQVLVPRLTRLRPPSDPAAGNAAGNADGGAGAWSGGTVLVTGGTDGLGALVARHLAAEHQVRELVLVSRRGASTPGVAGLEAELAALGAAVTVEACDVSDASAVTDLVRRYRDRLSAVVHAAGVLDDGVVTSLTPERLARVLAPKVAGAWHLHEATAGLDLAGFVVFSSVAGLLGGAGQAGYAAGNAFADGLIRARRASGLPGVSLVWGPWAQAGGMTGGLSAADRARIGRAGLVPLDADEGLQLFDAGLAAGEPVIVAARLDVTALASRDHVPPLLRGLARGPVRRTAAATAAAADLAGRLGSLPRQRQREELLALTRAQVALVLGHASAAAVDPATAFTELGFDSLTVVELRNRLDAVTGLRLPATVAFDYPTVAALAGFLQEELSGAAGARPKRLAAPAATGADPVVIVGMACRYPGGVSSPGQLWDLVAGQSDAITAFPADRGWDMSLLLDPEGRGPGGYYAREGGFLLDAADFDAGFFGMSPREALGTDPQQRLALELSWEALERSGIDPASLKNSQTGIFAGVMYHDYPDSDGNGSVVSGRVAYKLGLEGPAVTVDTACSSSLVALHLAAQSLRSGECSLAVAGGVTVLATPAVYIGFGRQRGLASDGRCKAFAEAADGTSFAEGAGFLVLERLSDARRHGHPVLAVIRGSAVNQDGASNGMTAPNGPSQQRVIRAALESASLSPADVDVVEGHGTGTSLGDPIEVQALMAAYGQDRERPLLLGSVKSNIGHAQAAAGVAGVIKMVMAMSHGTVPPTLHVDAPSSHVDWSAGAVRLATEEAPWPDSGRPRRAAVSSFGISGTNAHVILEQPEPEPASGPAPGAPQAQASETQAREGQAPETQEPEARAPEPPAVPEAVPWTVSARSAAALDAQLARVAGLAAGPESGRRRVDVGFSLATARSVFGHRAVLLAGPGGVTEVARGVAEAGRLAVLFPGQGTQRLGMGQDLYRGYGAFAEAMDGVCAALDEHLPVPLRRVMWGQDEAALEDTAYAQPALFATGVALYRLLQSLGVRPDFVAGHSVGEIAAAHVAGVLSLADACALVAARGALMSALPPGGAMTAIEATEAEVAPYLTGLVSLAAVNGPSSLVVSGEESAVRVVAERFPGRRTRRLRVSHAFHSPLMEPMLEEFAQVAVGLSFADPVIGVVSNVTGALAAPGELSDPGYWVRHVREPVRFGAGIEALRAAGAGWFAEAGPGRALSGLAAAGAGQLTAVPVLDPGRDQDAGEERALLRALARLHVAGADVDWAALFTRTGARLTEVPTYPFQRRRYWSASAGHIVGAAEHPVLSGAIELAGSGGFLATGRLSALSHSWLTDHAVHGQLLVPGTALLELALQTAGEVGCDVVRELTLGTPLVLPERGEVQVQVWAGPPDESGGRPLTVHSRPAGDPLAPWTEHAAGQLAAGAPPLLPDTGQWPPAGALPLNVTGLYERLADGGFGYGPAFQGLLAAWQLGEEIFAEVALPGDVDGTGFVLHPALLDACLHAGALAAMNGGDWNGVPFSWAGVSAYARGVSAVRVRLAPAGQNAMSITIADAAGAPVAAVDAMTARPVPAGGFGRAVARDSLFGIDWVPVPAGQPGPVVAIESGRPRPDGPWTETCPDLASVPVDGPVTVVIPVTGSAPGPAAVHQETARALAALQQWPEAGRSAPRSRLVFLTSGALSGADLAGAAVWGLVRTAQSENPGQFFLVDVEDGAALPPGALESDEPELLVRGTELLGPRLTRVRPSPGPPDWGDGTVLITGGASGLGAVVARHLAVTRSARELLLVSRRGPDSPGAGELAAELTGLGVPAAVEACDVADPAAVAGLLARHRVTAVIHAAGVLDDGVIGSLTPGRLGPVLAPKVDGAWNLHAAAGEELRAFVLFSSVAGTVGAPGQGSYAAANAFLDGLARHRRALGRPAVSLAWGPWTEAGGMADGLGEAAAARMTRSGMPPLSAEQGLALLTAAAASTDPVLLPVRLDLAALRARGEVPPLLRTLIPAPAARRQDGGAGLAARLAAMSADEGRDLLVELVRAQTAVVLGYASGAEVDPSQAFTDLGFDSLSAVEFRNGLAALVGLALPATLVFDYPTPQEIGAMLHAAIAGKPASVSDSILADLDRLEGMLAGLEDADEALREKVAGRLEVLRTRWSPRRGNGTAEPGAMVDLGSASDEEVFNLLDQQLGLS